jgi:predicted HicB family RNase H-like nuclease
MDSATPFPEEKYRRVIRARATPSLHEQVKAAADAEHVATSEFIRRAVVERIERQAR